MAWLSWEFLRRNEKYAEHAVQMLALPQGEFSGGLTSKGNACLDGMACTPKANPGETVKQYRKRVMAESNGKVKGRIEKPQSTFINRWMLEQPVPVDRQYDADAVQFAPNVVKVYRNKELAGRRVRLMMYQNEMAVRFRLDLPLGDQLPRAKVMLDKAVKRYKDAAKQSSKEKKDELLAFNGEARAKKFVEHDAHFWLRAYDASTEQKRLLDDTDKKRKRALKSGDSEIRKQFFEEGKKGLKRYSVANYKTAAKLRIEKLGYQAMIQVLEAAPTAIFTLAFKKMPAESKSSSPTHPVIDGQQLMSQMSMT